MHADADVDLETEPALDAGAHSRATSLVISETGLHRAPRVVLMCTRVADGRQRPSQSPLVFPTWPPYELTMRRTSSRYLPTTVR